VGGPEPDGSDRSPHDRDRDVAHHDDGCHCGALDLFRIDLEHACPAVPTSGAIAAS